MNEQIAKVGLGNMLGIGITVAVVGMAIAFSLNVLADVRDDFTPDTTEYNATDDAITGLAKLPSKLPLIMTVVVAAIIIGLLIRSFAFKG